LRPERTTCHTDSVCTPLWTTWDQPSDQAARLTQSGPRPQPGQITGTCHPQLIHNPRGAHAGATPLHPQHAQALILLLIYLLGFLFEEGGWGNSERSGFATGQRPSMSPRSISFQVEPESSTVIQRQPLRSSQRIVETRSEIPGNRWLALLCGMIEGTLWTWRRQLLASPI
jgi:hypothetical protein